MSQLTKEEIKILTDYLHIFQLAYRLKTGKKLETVSKIVDLIKGGQFTFEDDVWGIYLDSVLQYLSETAADYFDNHIEEFFHEVYFPNKERRLPDGGAWIKIRTKKGFEVHFAKKATRKIRWNEELEKKLKSSPTETEMSRIGELEIRMAIKLPVYEVFINRSKSKKEYYRVDQYTIIEDIELFTNAYMSSITGVYSRKLYTSANEDAVFYLQSRGIPKKAAEMMAALKQTYFIMDMEEALKEFNSQWETKLKQIGFISQPTLAQNIAKAGYEIHNI